MPSLRQAIESSERRFVWLDDAVYTNRVFGVDDAAWARVDQQIAHRRQVVGLLQSEVIVVPLALVTAEFVAQTPALKDRLAALPASRPVGRLCAMLADDEVRRHACDMVAGLRATFSGLPLVVLIPSPDQWLAELIVDPDVVIDGDLVDSAALRIADFLRCFGGEGVDALAIDAFGADGALVDGLLGPIVNVAAHYRWEIVELRGQVPLVATADVVLGGADQATGLRGSVIDPAYWGGVEESEIADAGDLVYSSIPDGAVPETVLDRLASLRGGARS